MKLKAWIIFIKGAVKTTPQHVSGRDIHAALKEIKIEAGSEITGIIRQEDVCNPQRPGVSFLVHYRPEDKLSQPKQ